MVAAHLCELFLRAKRRCSSLYCCVLSSLRCTGESTAPASHTPCEGEAGMI